MISSVMANALFSMALLSVIRSQVPRMVTHLLDVHVSVHVSHLDPAIVQKLGDVDKTH